MLFNLVEVETGGEVRLVVVGRTVYEALKRSEVMEEVDECHVPNLNALLWGTRVFMSSSIPDDAVLVAAYGSEGAVVERGILTR